MTPCLNVGLLVLLHADLEAGELGQGGGEEPVVGRGRTEMADGYFYYLFIYIIYLFIYLLFYLFILYFFSLFIFSIFFLLLLFTIIIINFIIISLRYFWDLKNRKSLFFKIYSL